MKTLLLFGLLFCVVLMAKGQDMRDTAWAERQVREATELIKARKYHEALVNLDSVEQIAVFWGRIIAKCQYLKGNIYLQRYKPDSALVFFNKSLSIQVNDIKPDEEEIANTQEGLGACYIQKGNNDEAIRYYEKAMEIYSKNPEYKQEKIASVYANLGICYGNKSSYDKSLAYYQKSLDIRLGLEQRKSIDIAKLYHYIGNIYFLMKHYEKALRFEQESIQIRTEINGETDRELAANYLTVGAIYNNMQNYEQALLYNKKSLNIFIQYYGENNLLTANSYNNLANTYKLKGDLDQAIQCHKKALGIRRKEINRTELHQDLAMSYNNLAQCYYLKTNYDSSLIMATLALRSNNFKNENWEEVLSFERLNPSFQLISLVALKQFESGGKISDIRLAYETARKAGSAMQFQRRRLTYSDSRSAQLNKGLWIHDNLISSLLHLYSITDSLYYYRQSFQISESAKSLSLFEALQESKSLQFSGIPDSLIREENNLRARMSAQEKKYKDKIMAGFLETDKDVLAINSKLFDLKRAYEALKDTFEHQYPDYYRLKYDLQVESVEDVQNNLLQPDQALLEYFTGDSSIFIFLVKKDDYRVIEVKKDFPLETWVKQLRHGIYGYHTDPNRNDNLRDSCVTEYIGSATLLYQKLLAPVDSLLPRRVVIVPDGVLGYIPFEALLTAKPEREDRFHTYPYFGREKGREHSISYCYSATLLREMTEKQHRRKPIKMLAAFAPYYDGDTTVLAGLDDLFATRSVAPGDLEPLKYSGAEVAAAQKLLGGDVFSDSVATEARFNTVAGDYRILHLSTHGKADDRAGDYSYLVFSPQKDSLENELLYCRDIYNLSLNADLVVLSACETGIGELKRGEGIISLARAFAYAGAKSIVTTLWSVDDAKTKDFMVFFYRNLKKGMAKDEALATARSDYFKAHKSLDAHPYFWAGFVGIGDMGVVRQ